MDHPSPREHGFTTAIRCASSASEGLVMLQPENRMPGHLRHHSRPEPLPLQLHTVTEPRSSIWPSTADIPSATANSEEEAFLKLASNACHAYHQSLSCNDRVVRGADLANAYQNAQRLCSCVAVPVPVSICLSPAIDILGMRCTYSYQALNLQF